MSKKRILILEDEDAIANTINYGLKREGYDTAHFTTIKAAKSGFQQETFDLLILDVGLPDGSGFDLCRDIRKSSDVPIFFLTARTEEIDRVLGLELGADDYITKPFSPRELVARVKSLFRRVTNISETKE